MSAFFDIMAAVRDRLVTALDGAAEVKIRKRAIYLETDSLPTVIISPSSEQVNLDAFGGIVTWDYTLQVTLVQAGNRVFEADVEAWLQLREDIRQQLYQPTLDGLANIVGMTIDMQPAFESVLGNVSNYDVSGMTITYQNVEARIT